MTRSQYSFCVPIPKKQWTENLSKYFLVIFRNSTGFYFCWIFVKRSTISTNHKKLASCSPLKWLWHLFPRNQTPFQGFWAAVVQHAAPSIFAGNCRPPLGVFFSENTRHKPGLPPAMSWKNLVFPYPKRNLRSPEDYMGFRVWPFWMGWTTKKSHWKTEFHSTAHFCLSSWNFPNSLIFFVPRKKKNVKELSVEYWLFNSGIPIKMVYF